MLPRPRAIRAPRTAKTPEAAEELDRRIGEAATGFDHVLIDTPPLGDNAAVAAATAAERVVVTPATERGVDAAQTTRGRLQDVGTSADAVVAVDRAGADAVPETDADAVIPQFDTAAPASLETEAGVEALAEGGLVETVSSLRES